jgi:hypothetical protein
VYRYSEAGMCRSGSDAMCRFGSDAMLRQDVCPVLQTRRWPTSQRKCGDT